MSGCDTQTAMADSLFRISVAFWFLALLIDISALVVLTTVLPDLRDKKPVSRERFNFAKFAAIIIAVMSAFKAIQNAISTPFDIHNQDYLSRKTFFLTTINK